MDNISLLPNEILMIIFEKCSVKTIVSSSGVCKRFNNLLQTQHIWKFLLNQDYQKFLPFITNYKQSFQRLYQNTGNLASWVPFQNYSIFKEPQKLLSVFRNIASYNVGRNNYGVNYVRSDGTLHRVYIKDYNFFHEIYNLNHPPLISVTGTYDIIATSITGEIFSIEHNTNKNVLTSIMKYEGAVSACRYQSAPVTNFLAILTVDSKVKIVGAKCKDLYNIKFIRTNPVGRIVATDFLNNDLMLVVNEIKNQCKWIKFSHLCSKEASEFTKYVASFYYTAKELIQSIDGINVIFKDGTNIFVKRVLINNLTELTQTIAPYKSTVVFPCGISWVKEIS